MISAQGCRNPMTPKQSFIGFLAGGATETAFATPCHRTDPKRLTFRGSIDSETWTASLSISCTKANHADCKAVKACEEELVKLARCSDALRVAQKNIPQSYVHHLRSFDSVQVSRDEVFDAIAYSVNFTATLVTQRPSSPVAHAIAIALAAALRVLCPIHVWPCRSPFYCAQRPSSPGA